MYKDKNGTKIPCCLYFWIAKWKTKDSAPTKGKIYANERPWPRFAVHPLKQQAKPSVRTVCIAALTRTCNHLSVRQCIRCSEPAVSWRRDWQLSSAVFSHSLLRASVSGSAGYWPHRHRGDRNSGRLERRQRTQTAKKGKPVTVLGEARRHEGKAPHFLCAIRGKGQVIRCSCCTAGKDLRWRFLPYALTAAVQSHNFVSILTRNCQHLRNVDSYPSK